MPRVIAGVPVPDTERAKLRARVNIAASEALYRWQRPDEIKGSTSYPCPGGGMTGNPCYCGASHVHYYTNHNRL
jgi:hypothetical protein